MASEPFADLAFGAESALLLTWHLQRLGARQCDVTREPRLFDLERKLRTVFSSARSRAEVDAHRCLRRRTTRCASDCNLYFSFVANLRLLRASKMQKLRYTIERDINFATNVR